MGNHKSAIKRHRQSLVTRERNRVIKSAVRTAIKRVRTAIDEGKTKEAKDYLVEAERIVAKAAAKGILHKKNAARRISRLSAFYTAKTATKKAK